MRYTYIKGQLEKNIEIKNLGIKIGKLNKNNVKNLVDEFSYLKSQEQKINGLLHTYCSLSEMKDVYDDRFIEWMSQVMLVLVNSKGKLNLNKDIEKLIDQLLVIEIDETLSNHYSDKELMTFVFKIIGLSKIINDDVTYDRLSLDKSNNLRLKPEMAAICNMLDSKQSIYNMDADVTSAIIELGKFIDKLSKDEIERFIEIVDLLYMDHKSFQNTIINNVLSIESLLISDTTNIEKNFILKCGIILKEENVEYNNMELSEIIRFVYNVRSDIVHGNTPKINGDYDRLKSKVERVEKLIDKSTITLKNKKEEPYAIASIYSNLILFNIIKYWIKNKEKLDYIKYN